MPKKTAVKSDPYMLDPTEDGTKFENQHMKVGSGGVFCPKRNFKSPCAVCDVVQRLFNSGRESDKDIARQKMAKCNFYLNVVFPSEPDKLHLMEIGKKAGNQILEGISKKGWKDIAHPKAGGGREMQASKSKDGAYNTYTITPSLEKADWDIPQSVIDSMYDLRNIIDILKAGEAEIFKISSMAMDETINFRICPRMIYDDGAGNVMSVVWRHWGGVTQAEVEGIDEINLDIPDFNGESETTESKESAMPWKNEDDTGNPVEAKRSECFGDADCFEEGHADCTSCDDYKDCKRTIKRGK